MARLNLQLSLIREVPKILQAGHGDFFIFYFIYMLFDHLLHIYRMALFHHTENLSDVEILYLNSMYSVYFAYFSTSNNALINVSGKPFTVPNILDIGYA